MNIFGYTVCWNLCELMKKLKRRIFLKNRSKVAIILRTLFHDQVPLPYNFGDNCRDTTAFNFEYGKEFWVITTQSKSSFEETDI